MTDLPDNFPTFEALDVHLKSTAKGYLQIAHLHCEGYEGMVLSIGLSFDVQTSRYELDLQWSCLGLDLYGDTLQENYVYRFEDLENLLQYLSSKYGVTVTDIPRSYQFQINQYPNPVKDESSKPAFEAAWQRFQQDFKSGAFRDATLKLVYSTQG
jgi:hypothetical protein